MTESSRWLRLRRNPARIAYNRTRYYFYQTAAPLVQAWSRRALRQAGHLDFLARRPPSAFPPDYADLHYLYRIVRSRRPRRVVEFGSGCSTVVMAAALAENAREDPSLAGSLISLETEEEWRDVTRASLPEELVPFCDVRHAPVEVTDFDGQQVFRHQNLPTTAIDLLYLDSPALTPEIRVAIDPHVLEQNFTDRFAGVVDGRPENVEWLQKHLQGSYRFRSNVLLGNTVFTRA